VIDNASRREQVREAMVRYRKRRKHAFLLRSIMMTKDQLDQPKERGYLNPIGVASAPTSATRSKCFWRMHWQNPDSVPNAAYGVAFVRRATRFFGSSARSHPEDLGPPRNFSLEDAAQSAGPQRWSRRNARLLAEATDLIKPVNQSRRAGVIIVFVATDGLMR
jgi:hypothetical protein